MNSGVPGALPHQEEEGYPVRKDRQKPSFGPDSGYDNGAAQRSFTAEPLARFGGDTHAGSRANLSGWIAQSAVGLSAAAKRVPERALRRLRDPVQK
jgi:hypothetical protein